MLNSNSMTLRAVLLFFQQKDCSSILTYNSNQVWEELQGEFSEDFKYKLGIVLN